MPNHQAGRQADRQTDTHTYINRCGIMQACTIRYRPIQRGNDKCVHASEHTNKGRHIKQPLTHMHNCTNRDYIPVHVCIMHGCMCKYMRKQMCMYGLAFVCVNMCTCEDVLYTFKDMCIYIHIHIYTYIYMYIYTRIYTHISTHIYI